MNHQWLSSREVSARRPSVVSLIRCFLDNSSTLTRIEVMAQAIANPDELRAFAQRLKQFNTVLTDQAALLANQLETLSTSWRDQENMKFTEEFREHMRLLAQFVEANNQHIPYLLRKAERLDEYLQQR